MGNAALSSSGSRISSPLPADVTASERRTLFAIHALADADHDGVLTGQEMIELVAVLRKHSAEDGAALQRFSKMVVVDTAELIKALSELSWWDDAGGDEECWISSERRQTTLDAVLRDMRAMQRRRSVYYMPYTIDVPDPRQYDEVHREESESSTEASAELSAEGSSDYDAAVATAHRRSTASTASSTRHSYTAAAEDDEGSVGGLTWKVILVGDDYASSKHCIPESGGKLRPRRPTPHVRAADFFDGLRRDPGTGRWVFPGEINDWPGLTSLELRTITTHGRRNAKRLKFRASVRTFWRADTAGDSAPSFPAPHPKVKTVIATMRAPSWSGRGWSKSEPGCIFWFAPFYTPLWLRQSSAAPAAAGAAQAPAPLPPPAEGTAGAAEGGDTPSHAHCTPSFFVGEGACIALARGTHASTARATRISHIAHRYAKTRPTSKDYLTFHALVLIEWSHARWTTVVELAWRNGIGGYGGKSNWIPDKEDKVKGPLMYRTMPPSLKAPWRSDLSEVRICDHPARDTAEFIRFMEAHSGTSSEGVRFVKPTLVASAPVKLASNSPADVARLCINYIGTNARYSEERLNCQHFASDFYGLLAREPETVPFHPVCRLLYKSHSMDFLYTPPQLKIEKSRRRSGGGGGGDRVVSSSGSARRSASSAVAVDREAEDMLDDDVFYGVM